ncbi:hypothetical protein MPSEU_000976000 [Mayamaea pseudoterrestris]|nr:hypothetical protein MPSEU_000976000 [Mayamaea pseudoterrestris]
MRVALSAAALALIPVVEPFRRQNGRSRCHDERFERVTSLTSFSSSSFAKAPLWKQPNHRLLDAKPCDPTMIKSATDSDGEPDVGILAAACPRGYACQELPEQSDYGAFGGGICVATNDVTASSRNLQTMESLCTYYQDTLGYECDCSNWSNSTGNGTFECAILSGNATFFGLPVALSYNVNVESEQEGDPLIVGLETCFEALDDSLPQADLLQSYCISNYATYADFQGQLLNQSCTVTFNDQACTSCSLTKCNASDTITSIGSFDCSNVASDVVVQDMCDGNNILKQLFAADYPTTEPTGYPTFEPSVGVPTIDTLPPDDAGASSGPTPLLGSNNASNGRGDAAPTADDAAASESRAWSMSVYWSAASTALVTGLLGLGAVLN